MEFGRTTLSKYLMQEQRRIGCDTDLSALLNDVQTACKYVASAIARGELAGNHGDAGDINVQGEVQKKLDVLSNELFIRNCEAGGHLCGMASEEMDQVLDVAEGGIRGPYLLVFDPLDGSSNLDVNLSVGSIFSVLRAPDMRCTGPPRCWC
jgi:fructose-1,6-bisphosphatase